MVLLAIGCLRTFCPKSFGGARKISGGEKSNVFRQEMHEILLKMAFNCDNNHNNCKSKILGAIFPLLSPGPFPDAKC